MGRLLTTRANQFQWARQKLPTLKVRSRIGSASLLPFSRDQRSLHPSRGGGSQQDVLMKMCPAMSRLSVSDTHFHSTHTSQAVAGCLTSLWDLGQNDRLWNGFKPDLSLKRWPPSCTGPLYLKSEFSLQSRKKVSDHYSKLLPQVFGHRQASTEISRMESVWNFCWKELG